MSGYVEKRFQETAGKFKMEEEIVIHLEESLTVIRRRWVLVLAIFLASIFLGLLINFRTPPLYEVNATITLGGIIDPGTAKGVLLSNNLLAEVTKQVKAGVATPGVEDLKKIIAVQQVSGNQLAILVWDENPQRAEEISRAVVEAFVRYIEAGLKYNQLDLAKSLLKTTEENIARAKGVLKQVEDAKGLSPLDKELKILDVLAFIEKQQRDYLEVSDRLVAAQKPLKAFENLKTVWMEPKTALLIRPKKGLNMMMAVMFGIVIGISTALVIEYVGKINSGRNTELPKGAR